MSANWRRNWLERLLALVAPKACCACGARESADRAFCRACGAPSPVSDALLDGVPVVAAGSYAPPLSTAIQRFKFGGHPELAGPLASLLHGAAIELAAGHDVAWVPVPLHHARLIERGFNQAALLARALSRVANGRFAPRLLERRRETAQQARLGRGARAENAHGAFGVRALSRAHRIVLVDDVVTTGATARACLDALRAAGTDVLAIVALAHGLRSQ